MKKPSKEVQEYWDKVLHDNNLGPGRAQIPRGNLVGLTPELDIAQSKEIVRKTGRKKPTGRGPEK